MFLDSLHDIGMFLDSLHDIGMMFTYATGEAGLAGPAGGQGGSADKEAQGDGVDAQTGLGESGHALQVGGASTPAEQSIGFRLMQTRVYMYM